VLTVKTTNHQPQSLRSHFCIAQGETKSSIMKQREMFTLMMALGLAAFTSCNNSADTTASNDDSTEVNSTANTSTSSGDYSAYADKIEQNSTQGYYLDPRTGKPYSKLTVDRSTGAITDENNEPVWRYVDSRDWWVYGVDDNWNWRKIGEAKMNNDQLQYKDDNGNWVSYDQRWKVKDDNNSKEWKMKSGDTKIKFDEDGDIKVKTDSGTTKYDASDDEIKKDDQK
jgi:hypothetical protein